MPQHAGGTRRRRTLASLAGGTRRRRTLASLAVALAARLLAGPLPLNYYDVGYALVWGREIVHGHLPNYRTPGASTPHPLGTLLGAVAALLGTPGGWYFVQLVVFLSLGVAATALFVLTRGCLRRISAGAGRHEPQPVAATLAAGLAVGALLLSPPFLTDALGGSGLSDLPALALVLAAAALAADHPERVRSPLVLLGLAGLLRPEAWGLAGAYWLYLAHRRPPLPTLLQTGVLVAAAPLLWVLSDAIVTGSPTYSLTHTQDASQSGMFEHGLAHVPGALVRDLRALVGLPVLAVGALGAVAAARLARRATAPALALLAVALGEFAALGAADVPLLERFLLVPAAMTCLFFGWALVAGHELARGRPGLGLAWTVLSAVLVLYLAGSHLSGDLRVRPDQRPAVHAEADLVSLAQKPGVRAALRACPRLHVPRFTLTSLAAVDFDRPPQTILRTAATPPTGLVLAPTTAAAGRYFGLTPARLRVLRRVTGPGSVVVGQNRSWRLLARGCANG
jgi:hypothetical protein